MTFQARDWTGHDVNGDEDEHKLVCYGMVSLKYFHSQQTCNHIVQVPKNLGYNGDIENAVSRAKRHGKRIFDEFMERSECLVSKCEGTVKIDHCSGFLLVGVSVQRMI